MISHTLLVLVFQMTSTFLFNWFSNWSGKECLSY